MLALGYPNRRYGSNFYGRLRSRSLIKGRKREPLLIVDSHFSPSLQISQSRARGQWPALLHECWRTGNRRVDAMQLIGRSFVSQNEYDAAAEVVEWMKERMQHYPFRSRINPYTGQPHYDLFETLFQNAREAFRLNDGNAFDEQLSRALRGFEVLSDLIKDVDLQSGELFDTLIRLAERFIPLFSEHDEVFDQCFTMQLIAAMDKITRQDRATLEQLCDILTPQAQQDLLNEAMMGWQQGRIFLCYRILNYLQ